jgi:putative copper export protein
VTDTAGLPRTVRDTPAAHRVAARGPARVRACGVTPGRPVTLVVVIVLSALAALVVPLLGAPLALHGTGEAAPPGAGGIALLRGVVLIALCVPVGEAYVARLARRVPGVRQGPPSRVVPAAIAGFLAALGLACVVSAGNLIPRRLSDLDVGDLYRTRDGVLALVEVNAFWLAALWARAPDGRPARMRRLAPPAAVVAAEALRAHPPAESSPLFGSALTAVHLSCAALWLGGLWQVLRTVRLWRAGSAPVGRAGPVGQAEGGFVERADTGGREPSSEPGERGGTGGRARRHTPTGPTGTGAPTEPTRAGGSSGPNGAGPPTEPTDADTPPRPDAAAGMALLTAYARLAAVLLAALVVTGALSTLRRMPPSTVLDQLVTTAYGRTLLAKVLLVAVAAALALAARLRLAAAARPRPGVPARIRDLLRPGGPGDPLTACAPARVEVAVLGVVVAASALLTALPVPIRW